jgi:23S rRNA (adenine2503-C2)-methyltransferase
MLSILGLTKQQFSDAMVGRFGKGRRHASQLYAHLLRTGTFPDLDSWSEPQAIPLLREMVAQTALSLPSVRAEQEEERATKSLFTFGDGLAVESVVIEMQAGLTLCVSSQVGCKRGCAFCETGKMGLLRNLTPEEIVAQVFHARFVLGRPIRNIVFMGMGEPFDNFDGVMQAIRVLTDPGGFGFGPRHITVSTSGHVEGIDRFGAEADRALNLAVSISAPNDELRRRLMPINKQWDLAAIRSGMERYLLHPRRHILVSYVLLDGVNDAPEHAEQLADYLEGLRVKINLITYNEQKRDRFARSQNEEVFAEHLRGRGYNVFLRRSKGSGILAACGQLATRNQSLVKMGTYNE